MTEPCQGIPAVEYRRRVATIRQNMAALRIDGMLLTNGPNLTYVSGYPSSAVAGHDRPSS